MKSKFHVDGWPGTVPQEGCDHRGDSNRQEHRGFASDFHQLLKDETEPDSQFFVECWTLGVNEAISNLQVRLCVPADCFDVNIEIDDPGFVDESFPEMDEMLVDFFSPERPSHSVVSSPLRQTIGCAVNGSTKTPDGDDPVENRSAETCGGRRCTGSSITTQRACQVLGVTMTSTRAQIRAAYRQKVREWHPDRHGNRTESARRYANERMTEINEAYHLLQTRVI